MTTLERLINLRRDEHGNMTIMFAFAVVPLLLSVGLGIDYASATARQAQLNGIADAAALSAVTPAMINVPGQTAAQQKAAMEAQATSFFNAQSASVTGIGSVTPHPVATLIGTKWTIDVPYTTTSTNAFAQILGMPTMNVGGFSEAQAAVTPNIDFWMMIDTSPSMAIAATQAGIDTMVLNTQKNFHDNQNIDNGLGCAFGCHEYSPAKEGSSGLHAQTLKWPRSVGDTASLDTNGYYFKSYTGVGTLTQNNYQCVNSPVAVISTSDPAIVTSVAGATLTGAVLGALPPGGTAYPLLSVNGNEDLFVFSRCAGVVLRIDLVNDAIQALMTQAPGFSTTNGVVYRAALYTFDYDKHQLVGPTSSGLIGPTATFTPAQGTPSLKSVAGTLGQLVIDRNGCLNAACNAPKGNGDQDTYFDQTLVDLNTVMPTPGNGTKLVGDTPQEVLYIVSDALPDTANSRIGANGSFRGVAKDQTLGDYCTIIKARGIRIAFLYLTYNPLPTNPFYVADVAPMQPTIQPLATACASPGLFFEVSTGGNVSDAMIALFKKAATTAILVK